MLWKSLLIDYYGLAKECKRDINCPACYALKNKAPKGDFDSDATVEPFWFPRESFSL